MKDIINAMTPPPPPMTPPASPASNSSTTTTPTITPIPSPTNTLTPNNNNNNNIININNNNTNNINSNSNSGIGIGGGAGGLPMSAKAVLTCRPNSHPFQDRSFALDQSVKIGRSVARSRPNANNAIFDCKVLSRNHALLWYENGKFLLQDTKSSNGTFVNNQRLSKSSEESLPFQVSSGDILQFGVDVMEVTKKDPSNTDSMIDAVTHGCIVATLQLYLPDGKEAKASSSTQLVEKSQSSTLEMYQINQVVKEALQREQLIDTKLAAMSKLVGSTKAMMGSSWKALINEDRLLSKVEALQRQLHASHKGMTDDKLRDEITKLHEDKEKYTAIAKQKLKESQLEKLESIKKLNDLERNLSATEQERSILKEIVERTNNELNLVANKYDVVEKKSAELLLELNTCTENYKVELDRLNKVIQCDAEELNKKQGLIDSLVIKLEESNNTNITNTNNSQQINSINKLSSLLLDSNSNTSQLQQQQYVNNLLNNSNSNSNNLDEFLIMDNNSNNNNNNSAANLLLTSDNNNSNNTSTTTIDEVQTTQQHDNVQVLDGGVGVGSEGSELKQFNNHMDTLLRCFEELLNENQPKIEPNHSEAIVELINKISEDVHQIQKLTSLTNNKLYSQQQQQQILNNTTTAINYNQLNRVEDEQLQLQLQQEIKDKDVEDDEAEKKKKLRLDEDYVKDADDDDVDNVIIGEGENDETLKQILADSRQQVLKLSTEKSALQERVNGLEILLFDYTKKYDMYKAEADKLASSSKEQTQAYLSLQAAFEKSETACAQLQNELKLNAEISLKKEKSILQLKDELSALKEYKTETEAKMRTLSSSLNANDGPNSSSTNYNNRNKSSPTKPSSTSSAASLQCCAECLASFTPSSSRTINEHNIHSLPPSITKEILDKLCNDCFLTKIESHNEKLRLDLNVVATRLMETEEELSIYKEQFHKSSATVSKLEEQLMEHAVEANSFLQWFSMRYVVPLLILLLAIAIAFHPSS